MSKLGSTLEQLALLACLYLISYQLILLVWGNHGLIAYQKLLLVQQELQQHYDELEKHQQNLTNLSEQVRTDSNYITIEARNLGYYQNHDKLILINTWSQAQSAPSPGDQMILENDVLTTNALDGISFFSILLAAGLWLIIRILHFGHNDILPHEFSTREREKFPLVYHGKTSAKSPAHLRSLTANSKRNKHKRRTQDNPKRQHHAKDRATTKVRSLDNPSNTAILVAEPFFPKQASEEPYQTLYRN